MLNDLYLIGRVRYVNIISVVNPLTEELISELNDKFLVGINEDGPWGYYYSE
jgi:hypothetical protein